MRRAALQGTRGCALAETNDVVTVNKLKRSTRYITHMYKVQISSLRIHGELASYFNYDQNVQSTRLVTEVFLIDPNSARVLSM